MSAAAIGAEPDPIQQADSAARTVTSGGRRPGTPAAERKRQQRERDKALLFQIDDWQLFLDPKRLPQKAGCQPADLRRIVLRELVDNALDAGAKATLQHLPDGSWIVDDDGPGLDPADVPRVFAVNRPLLSSKRLRLPLRGMLGNGLRVVMGAVAASEGSLAVETRGRRLALTVAGATGMTSVTSDSAVPLRPGLRVHIMLGPLLPQIYIAGDGELARIAIAIASCGKVYHGGSSPWWYAPRDLYGLMQQVMPADTTVGRLCRELGFPLDDDRIARSHGREDAAVILDRLRAGTKPVPPERLGMIGPDAQPGSCYATTTGFTSERGARIPYVAEAWAYCRRAETRGDGGSASVMLLLNRTPSAANITAHSFSGELEIRGCGLYRRIKVGTADYVIIVSVITPYIELATDGKEPALSPFSEAIAEVLRKACGAAHRAMGKPPGGMSQKDAAWLVMPDAYRKAAGSAGVANARQIMYAARPEILRLTGKPKLDSRYFTQTLLPDYVEENPEDTADWDVVFDARGHFVEPHTDRAVSLGTLEVRQYLGERPMREESVEIDDGWLSPTAGPENRYSAILFIEKEGFAPLLERARIAERFDIAIMSTKGMSTTAARMLLDRLAPRIDKVLVLHDFDVSGFSIFGTLGTDGRRYSFENVVPIVDIGLRLADVEKMALQYEPVEPSGDWSARVETLEKHGASWEEMSYLRSHRVELNAMTSDVLIAFLERKFAEHGIGKVVPGDATLEQHARNVLVRAITNRALDEVREAAEAEAAATALPADLRKQVKAALKRNRELPWDVALAALVRDLGGTAA